MCKFCDGRPLRLLTRPLGARDIAEGLSIVAAIRSVENAMSDKCGTMPDREFDVLVQQATHLRSVFELRATDYTDARRAINLIRSYKC